MIKKYNDFVNEGSFKNSVIVGLIAMSLLNSCHIFKHHRKKDNTTTQTPKDDTDIADYVYKKWGISSGNTEHKDKKTFNNSNTLANNFEHNLGKLPWPIECGEVCMKFGIQKSKYSKTVDIKSNGITISSPTNSKVHPVFNGVISKIFSVCGETTIIITHGNYYTVYSGFTSLSKETKIGHKVNTKTLLGFSKNEIDFQIWKNVKGKAIAMDPVKWLAKS